MLRDTESYVRLREEVTVARAGRRSARRAPLRRRRRLGRHRPRGRRSSRHDPDVAVLTTPFDLGHQRAIVYGLRFSPRTSRSDDVVVTMDSDGEDQPPTCRAWSSGWGDRRRRSSWRQRTKRSEPLGFRAMYVCFRLLFRVLTGTTIRSGNFAAQRGESLVAHDRPPELRPVLLGDAARPAALDGDRAVRPGPALRRGARG